MNEKEVLIIKDVTKLYDNNRGISSISSVINKGEIISIIGPNGAGKTTLVKCIAGLLRPSDGIVSLLGMSTYERKCKSSIGYMQNELDFYRKMTLHEILVFICHIKYQGKFKDEIEIYLKKYNLFEYRNSYVSELSLGMKKKFSIIISLIGTPQLILLDEPTNGVDTSGILQLKNDLIECSKKGSIVIVTSHVLDFLEKICTRCLFLKDGIISEDVLFEGERVDLEAIYEELYIVN